MSAHFVHHTISDKHLARRGSPLHTSPSTSPIHHLNRPHASDLESGATLLEMLLLLAAMLALLALVIWVAWIVFQDCIKFVRRAMDELDVGKQTKKNVKRAEEVPSKIFKVGLGVGFDLGQVTKGFLNGFTRGEQGRERDGERRGLLRGVGNWERDVVMPRGAYVHGYGQDRERYGDGTNDSSGTRNTSVSGSHREDCDGHCALIPRRWSGEA
jgi:hypothetical protein